MVEKQEASTTIRLTDRVKSLLAQAVRMADECKASKILLLAEQHADWSRFKSLLSDERFLLVSNSTEILDHAEEHDLATLTLDPTAQTTHELLAQALLDAVADDILKPGSSVVAMYSGFGDEPLNTLSVLSLGEHLNMLSGRELRQLESSVPLDTLKVVVDIALEIGKEGREGKAIGTLFVVGDSRKVLATSRPAGYDPVKGYNRSDRSLFDSRSREGIKEIAQLDGAIIISADGTVEATCRILDCSVANVHLSKGLGARHWAAAAVSRATNAIAVAVSETNGTVRIMQNGEVVLRIEPSKRRPIVWK